MTNNVRGIVTREIDGESYSFRLGANEWCELEADLGKSTGAILKDLERVVATEEVDISMFRTMFRAALTYKVPDATLRDAGELMSALGLEGAGLLIAEIVQAGMPEVKGTPGKPKRAAAKR
ncbi:hypothetical protein [Ensifer sp. 1H6]|uniref:hypothetical protein n=1 Tax=Ensifer sp. 1H6 TaxID=1911585 RepID=UPI0009CFCBB6|nr:hypothetical protein [Ensifer sp. 1H6]OMQ44927.1 hypothetical protein BKP54_11070 [Ensifer sp. 1H6]